MYDPLVLFYVGIVLILNGLWTLGRIGDREILIVNALIGLLFLRTANELAFGQSADVTTVRQATFSLMFAFTYLWVAYNRLTKCDGRGLGWYSLVVSITALWVSMQMLTSEGVDLWSLWSALSWIAWAILWMMFFVMQVFQAPWGRVAGWTSVVQGVITGWLPALFLLRG